MLKHGLVLINVKVDLVKNGTTSPKKILAAIRDCEGVLDAYVVIGRFGIVVFTGADDYNKLRDITAEIAKIEGIKSSETLMQAD